jgi:hypothetical protein
MKDIASLSDAERAKLYRGYADAMRTQAERASGGTRDYFLRMADSWDQLAGSIDRLSNPALRGSKKPDPGPDTP